MKPIILSAACAMTLCANTASAATVGAFSELAMSHSFVINSGSTPAGLDIAYPSTTYTIEVDASSAVAHPAATGSESIFAQVGNPFTTPATPFIAQRTNATQLPSGFEGSVGQYDHQITARQDPDIDNTSSITSRDVARSGGASLLLLDDSIAAAAASYVRSSRDVLFTNTTGATLSFNVAGMFDATLRAEYVGDNGTARAAGGFGLQFSNLTGAAITYFPVAPYLTTLENSAIGATVNHQLFANSGGITGLQFNASASAIGDGGTVLAAFTGQHRYVFGVTLDPYASVTMGTSLSQANSVDHRAGLPVPPVPLPASAFFLALGLGALASLRRVVLRAA